MPIYEYECTNCGEITEAIQRFSEKPLKKCSRCSGKLQKLISQSAFHLKGTGWYVTDYAGKSNARSDTTQKQEKESKPKETKSASSTDKKPSGKTTDKSD